MRTTLSVLSLTAAMGIAMSASAGTTRVDYDPTTQTVTTVIVTDDNYSVTADEAGVLSNASSASNWPETTVAFILDFNALEDYISSEEEDMLILMSLTTSYGTTVGVYMAADGTIGLLNSSSIWGTYTKTLSELKESSLTTLILETEMNSNSKVATYLYASTADGSTVSSVSPSAGLGVSGTAAAGSYVNSVTVNASYVEAFSVTNATLVESSEGVGAAVAALTTSASVPEPAAASLSLLGLGAMLLRRRGH